jgi:hypothetical protein
VKIIYTFFDYANHIHKEDKKENDAYSYAELIILQYLESHEKVCSQTSVSTYTMRNIIDPTVSLIYILANPYLF